ncbi:M50 family metallopeptidase [Sulfitobacter sp. M220]|uniref:M50 family metallopeptidase n=1 Tax=Sulfitobacter sp. M220 TaxID=2675333 RepID=UPI001F401AB9|nr:M50 family metallopeptidase [Sulfitobacter sp. M220]
MTSSADAAAARRRLSPAVWTPGAPLAGQMTVTAILGLAVTGTTWAVAPDMAGRVAHYTGSAVHELGHAAASLIQGGRVHEIALNAGGGHAITSGGDRIASAVAGPLAVPALATAVIVAALCRWGIQVWLAVIGLGLAVLAIGAAEDVTVRWALLPTGAALAVAAIAPIYEALRASLLFCVGLALVWATIQGIPYLASAEAVMQDGSTVPSDTGRVADLLDVPISDVRDALILTMVGFGLLGMAVVGRFLRLHGRTFL